MDVNSDIISALIQAGGAIVAALIAALFAKGIVKQNVGPYFRTYADTTHDLRDITQKAKSDIFVVTAIGDMLLKEYSSEFDRRLKSGITIRYLLLDLPDYLELEQHMWQAPSCVEGYRKALGQLRDLKQKYPQNLDIRMFHGFMPTSYIGVDIWPDAADLPFLPSSVIHVMIYQYHILAENSPICHFSPRGQAKQYETTVATMKKMWDDAGTNLSMSDLNAKILSAKTDA